MEKPELNEPEGTQEPSEGITDSQESNQADEFDLEKSDNIKQIREHAKGLKTDLDIYKPSHEFISDSFGDIDTARQAESVYNTFTASEFDPNTFVETLTGLSSDRTKALSDALANERADELVDERIEKLFGSKVTPEKVKLFQNWEKGGFGLSDDDGIPQFDSEGNPLDDTTKEYLKGLKEQLDSNNKAFADVQKQEKARLEQDRLAKIEDQKSTFNENRLRVLDSEFDAYNLNPVDGDNSAVREEKALVRELLTYAVSGVFMARGSEDSLDAYATAIDHINKGESALANRHKATIEAGLLRVMRSKPIEKLLKAYSQEEEPQKPIKEEISSSSSSDDSGQSSSYNRDEIFQRLVDEGKIQL